MRIWSEGNSGSASESGLGNRGVRLLSRPRHTLECGFKCLEIMMLALKLTLVPLFLLVVSMSGSGGDRRSLAGWLDCRLLLGRFCTS